MSSSRYIKFDEGGGPRFWTAGALYPLGLAIDHPSIVNKPELWARSDSIVKVYTENEITAADLGYDLNMRNDTFNQTGRKQGYKSNPIPGFLDLEARTWPTQQYIVRWLQARAELSDPDLHACDTLQDQLDLMCTDPGWSVVGDAGVLHRPFENAVQHVLQLQFFGIEATKVSYN